jgi:hypothetical protein
MIIISNHRRQTQRTRACKDRNNAKDIDENPDKIKDDANYEQVENELLS